MTLYSGGRLLFNGQFLGNNLLFRERFGMPGPAPLILLALGVAIVWFTWRRRSVSVLLLAWLAANQGFAQVDQDHWTDSHFIGGYNLSFGLQQEFTPTLDSMDTIQLKVGQGGADAIFPNEGFVAVNVRDH